MVRLTIDNSNAMRTTSRLVAVTSHGTQGSERALALAALRARRGAVPSRPGGGIFLFSEKRGVLFQGSMLVET